MRLILIMLNLNAIYYATHSKRPKCHRNLPRYDTDAVIKACGLRSISDFQLLTLERRKSVIQEVMRSLDEVMRSLDVRPRQLSRVTGMNYETIRNIAKKIAMKTGPHTQVPVLMAGG